MLSVIRAARLTPYQSAYCALASFRFYLGDVYWRYRQRIRGGILRSARRMGITRSRLRSLAARFEGGD